MKFVPQMVERVVSNAYTVRTGDTVASISEGFTGNPLRCDELVGANYHKRIMRCNDLPHFIFASLVDGETLNIPAEWSDAPNVSMGVSGVSDGTIGQTDALATALTGLIQDGANAGGWPMPVSPPANVAGMLSQWWPYLQAPPNSYDLPAINTDMYSWVAGVPAWLPQIGFPNTPNRDMLGSLIGIADRWVTQFGLPAQPVAWDSVPWSKLAAIMAAFGGNTAQLQAFFQMISKLVSSAWTSGGLPTGGFSRRAGVIHGTPSCPDCAAPKFSVIDPRDEPFNTLVKWFVAWPSSGVNPANVPWDIATDPAVLACISAHPTRVDEMKADAACFPNVPTACGDAKSAFKKMLCAPVYTPGWCKSCGVATDCLADGKMPCSTGADCCLGLDCVNSVCRKHGYVSPNGGAPEPTGVNKEGQRCDLGASIGCEAGLSCVNGVCSKPSVAVATRSTSVFTIIAATVGAVGLAYLGYRAMQPKRNPVEHGGSSREVLEMRAMLVKHGYDPDVVTTLSNDGIGPEELKQRIRNKDLERTYMFQADQSAANAQNEDVLAIVDALRTIGWGYDEAIALYKRGAAARDVHAAIVRSSKSFEDVDEVIADIAKHGSLVVSRGGSSAFYVKKTRHRGRKNITLESGQYGWDYLIVHDDGRDVLIQTDHDYPSVASTFGWSGRVLKKFGTGYSAEIRSAQEWLDKHIGVRAEDPGYFDGETE